MSSETKFKAPPRPEDYDTLSDASGYARPTDDFGETAAAIDPIGNLLKLRKMLIDKRRYLAQDAITYPVTFVGRAQDIAELQKLIDQLDVAIDHERSIQDAALSS
ncbi:MAG: hypothetical protein J0I57_15855 [Hyphomicrobium sp.]|nr:hypothetical protein [Hyphomicrobium sp.]ODT24396.1 MAG: hypothetical protein ABS54_09700 [Hyphomicrobium sp. SCN 65-11]OJU20643.1 MAG: hypothetical protein BGN89_11200 [Alphaproteobacteria bacterium 64-6]